MSKHVNLNSSVRLFQSGALYSAENFVVFSALHDNMSYLTYSCPQEASSSWEPTRRYFKHSLSPLMVIASTDTTSAQKRCSDKHEHSLFKTNPNIGYFSNDPQCNRALLTISSILITHSYSISIHLQVLCLPHIHGQITHHVCL